MNPLTLLANPWLLLGFLLYTAAITGTGYIKGLHHGIDKQTLIDQKAISKVTSLIEANKAEADRQLIVANANVANILVERDNLKTQLQQEHQTNVQTTDKLRAAYSAYGLRFQSDNTGCGASGTNPVPPSQNTASNASPAVCQLSNEASVALRAIVYDCDTLRDDYKLLYDWSHAP